MCYVKNVVIKFLAYPYQDDDSTEYRQLRLLQRVKRDKEMERGKFPFEHLGYKVRK
jgi:hypothetical protein